MTVDMGPVKTNWEEIPMAEAKDTLHVDIEIAQENSEEDPLIWDPIAVNVGNPHLVFLVTNPNAVDLEAIGPLVENSDLFPQGINVGMALINGEDTIRLRGGERGAGVTSAAARRRARLWWRRYGVSIWAVRRWWKWMVAP